MTTPYQPPPALVGSSVGNYKVERKLGEGGMGEVYLARHPELGREVAVKILAGALSGDATAIGRFRQEAMAACRIGHDAIVEILDIGQLADGRHYYVMEHLQGQSLHEYLETAGALPPQTCLDILRPVLAALAAAHGVGIVHRDIKPDNLFLSANRDGSLKVKVLDFGIAKLVNTTVPPLVATRSGALIGTPLFMSPEQCAGTGDIGPGADIYAVGAVLFNMLTGRPPFIGKGMGEVLVQHMQAPPPSVRDFCPELSEGLDAVIQTCLAKQPAGRFQHIDALTAALETAITGTTPPRDAGDATLRLSGTTATGTGTGTDPTGPTAHSTDATVPRMLSQTSLSAAAAQHVPLPAAPTETGTSATVHRTLVVAVVIGLIIGAGAVTLGVFLGRSPTPSPSRSDGAKRAATEIPPDADAAGKPQPMVMPAPTGTPVTTGSRPHPGLPARQPPRPVPLPPVRRARPIPPASVGTGELLPNGNRVWKKPNQTQRNFGRQWLEQARKHYLTGRCQSAVNVALMSYQFTKSREAVRIIGRCSCRLPGPVYARNARWAYRRLGSQDRRAMKASCRITLP